ncbi:hypothetical protein [Pelagibius sp. Alg239-R121]|uniref:hypothetical protein n=1 Tax=Pelagibius sp. Alg239-R121 TaxID=2993448 RepID=UPI0024A6C114|nr:hypothetical protein [Pelagibius sp. Alg239-R121]
MCGLCGLLGIVHWTETSAHPDAFTGAARRTIRAERLQRTRIVNAALAPLRMKVGDFQASAYVLSSPTGRQEIVDDIQSVWGAAEKLRGVAVDPLDPNYLAALDRIGR